MGPEILHLSQAVRRFWFTDSTLKSKALHYNNGIISTHLSKNSYALLTCRGQKRVRRCGLGQDSVTVPLLSFNFNTLERWKNQRCVRRGVNKLLIKHSNERLLFILCD